MCVFPVPCDRSVEEKSLAKCVWDAEAISNQNTFPALWQRPQGQTRPRGRNRNALRRTQTSLKAPPTAPLASACWLPPEAAAGVAAATHIASRHRPKHPLQPSHREKHGAPAARCGAPTNTTRLALRVWRACPSKEALTRAQVAAMQSLCTAQSPRSAAAQRKTPREFESGARGARASVACT